MFSEKKQKVEFLKIYCKRKYNNVFFSFVFMQLDQMQLALPSRDYYLKKNSEAELKAYHNYMTNVAILLGANPLSAAEEFNRVIILEKQFANVCLLFMPIAILHSLSQKLSE